jgi:alpha-galactosidase
LAVDQHSNGNHPAVVSDNVVVWVAASGSQGKSYVAAFNRSESELPVAYAWKELGLSGSEYLVRDLWERKDVGVAKQLTAHIPAHGCVLYGVQTSDAR